MVTKGPDLQGSVLMANRLWCPMSEKYRLPTRVLLTYVITKIK